MTAAAPERASATGDVVVRLLGPQDAAVAAGVLIRGFDREPAKLTLMPI